MNRKLHTLPSLQGSRSPRWWGKQSSVDWIGTLAHGLKLARDDKV
jgi:hypothetical protein